MPSRVFLFGFVFVVYPYPSRPGLETVAHVLSDIVNIHLLILRLPQPLTFTNQNRHRGPFEYDKTDEIIIMVDIKLLRLILSGIHL
jgi:hypothetical protein